MKKFNSQICTTKEQSRYLLKLGLKPETADMSYYKGEPCLDPYEEMESPYDNMVLAAWSLHRLMEIGNIENVGFTSIKNAYDTCVSMIASHIKFGLLNKEYLKQ